jgi:hypothetical protein
MAKTKKRAPARAKKAKRSKTTVKTARKKVAKRATTKKAKSKVRRATKRVKKPAIESMRPQEEAVVETSVETTVVAAAEEPTPVAVVAADTIEVATSAPAEVEREGSLGPASDPDVSSHAGEPQLKVA